MDIIYTIKVKYIIDERWDVFTHILQAMFKSIIDKDNSLNEQQLTDLCSVSLIKFINSDPVGDSNDELCIIYNIETSGFSIEIVDTNKESLKPHFNKMFTQIEKHATNTI